MDGKSLEVGDSKRAIDEEIYMCISNSIFCSFK